MKKVRLGIVGLGQRGKTMLSTFLAVKEVDVVALCDVYQDRVDELSNIVKKERKVECEKYNNFSLMLKSKNIDAIYIASSWESHIDQAVKCMNAGIPCAMEVGGAYSLKQCWDLVKTYEKTLTPFMLMENCCFDKFELLCTALVRHNVLGEVVHVHGSYTHDLRKEICEGNINRSYRLRNYMYRNCENYPTHELGPIAKVLNINSGNRILSVSSVASKSVGLHNYALSSKCADKSLKNTAFKQSDIVSTNLICENGETITMTLNTTLPSHYSREFKLSCSNGYADMDTNIIELDGNEEEIYVPSEFNKKHFNSAEKFYKKYLPSCWKNITKEEAELGHGGMDIFLVRTFVDCLLNKKEMPIDVYDAATWYAVTPLSEKSIKHNGKPYKMPDFTRGKYKTRITKDVIKL